AYDYTLGRGTGANHGNWYLTSSKNTSMPEQDVHNNDLRPEAGTYTTNLVAANTMFVTRLHERLGQTQYVDAITGEPKATSMWMRHE
ncbi:autotransporter outer membrane beta-barrel domain-containing protein, partial [Escherichia coli]